MRRPRHRALAAVAAATTLLVLASGCGGTSGSGRTSDAATHQDGSSMSMTPEEMAAMDDGAGPSSSATMVCGKEIASSVQKTLQLASRPTGMRQWNAEARVFTCTYAVPGGRLVVSVRDARTVPGGAAQFALLRRTLPGVQPIRGVEALGFPAFSTRDGDVLFLKDGKTLRVDPSQVPVSALPEGLSREDAAYGVAASVIACWKE